MVLLLALVVILSGEPALCLQEEGAFTLDGDIRQFAVTTDTVYIATEETLYQLSHSLTLVQSLSLRGILKEGKSVEEAQFHRVSETTERNATFNVHVLLPFVANKSLVSCGATDNGCGYCEVLDLNNIKTIIYSERIQVGPLRRSSGSVAFLMNIENRGTYILTALRKEERHSIKCNTDYNTVNIHDTSDEQGGGIFSTTDTSVIPPISSGGDVEFVDGFQINSTVYLLSNVQSGPRNNKVRLVWLTTNSSKTQTLRSLRGATLVVADGAESSRLVASSVIPGEPPVLWSGVFSVDGGQTNTELVVFDISPDLTIAVDQDPDFCFGTCTGSKPTPKRLKPKAVLLRQNYMTSVLALRQRVWMVFFMGTSDGQLIKLVVDKNYHPACLTVLYRANDNRPVFPKIHLDQVDHKHVYVALRHQVKRVPVSNCSTFTNLQECLSAQDPNCVWCSSKRSCEFEDDCKDSEWLSIPEDFHNDPVSYKLERSHAGQLKLIVQTHLTTRQKDLSGFACQFVGAFGEMCDRNNPPPQFPQCTCILRSGTLPDEGLNLTVRFRLGTVSFTEQLKLNNCSNIRGSPSSFLCERCVKSGCSWSKTGCSWDNLGVGNASVCQTIKSKMSFSPPEISSISPSVVSLYGRNHAVLSGYNLSDVTRVRFQRDTACAAQESPVWNNTGVNLTFHIPSTDYKGVVSVCVVLPDGSCHGNYGISYQSSPTCIRTEPNSTWFSGKRTITLIGSHLEFVEGVIHSHNPQDVTLPRSSNSGNLTYETAAAKSTQQSFFSSVSLKVANETLVCSTSFKYHPDPEFIAFNSLTTMGYVLIIVEKKKHELEMTTAELSVWGVHGGKQHPCIMTGKETSNKMEFFHCHIKNIPDVTFQELMIQYGDRTVRLGPPSLLPQVLLILRVLIPCMFVVLVMICRWQKKLTTEKKL
ncbi:plexin-C1-like isoform X1 [Betta splendens]|uniref:Plexin-C1-like isoform X1 n=1 Tax=Betta splendens TaxID=158456 RepID=A0A6P7NDF1_BETSP|nr:plexin-C1-like isoform X1 [Betta splendens]